MAIPKVGDRVEVIKKGKVVASAHNLEVLSRYHRQNRYAHPVSKSKATMLPIRGGGLSRERYGEGLLRVWFADGAKSVVRFASYVALKDWLDTKRKRSGWA